jgi:hemoglobin
MATVGKLGAHLPLVDLISVRSHPDTGGCDARNIYERIGGAPAVEAVVDLFYEKVWSDPALAGYFEGIDRDRLKEHQREFVSAALGGPERYDGRNMGEAHAGLGITDAVFYQVVAHLAATLIQLGVDKDTIGEIAISWHRFGTTSSFRLRPAPERFDAARPRLL